MYHDHGYAVIFTSRRTATDNEAYAEMAQRMEALARKQPGFLGIDSARNDIGITISYWRTLEDIERWKQHGEHQIARKLGRSRWYEWWQVRVCKIERAYGSLHD